MIKSVLIANRGAIATRIIRTLKTMGLRSIAVYAEADRYSLHVQQADEAYSLGEGPAASTYLDQDKLFDIIKGSKADAVHPGYGFLSENPDFVRRCEQAEVVFLGPTAEQIEAFGLKHRARALAQQAKVPLVPGSDLLDSVDEALTQAQTIGYPLMLKSTAGGGGIGMQLCRDASQLSNAFDSVQRLSQNNFGNSGVFIEKYIETSRHVEVQVLGDGQGQILTLGARDCSLQRRNQKVIEETPPPLIAAELIERMEHTAERLMQSLNYRSAGTVEYIYDVSDGQFYFLEVNTRLQVEHGVTEAIFGLDLVRLMIAVGQNLTPDLETLRQSLKPKGHSIQARLYAEDPNKNFQPCAGELMQVEWPDNAHQWDDQWDDKRDDLRIDHWIETGQTISPFYDPMLGKLIVHGKDRAEALDKLSLALRQTQLYGIETNLDYLGQVLDHNAVREGHVHTHLLDEIRYQPATIDVIAGGTLTTLQDYPGRQGYWHVGVPPSGPFDNWSFRLGNRILGNPEQAAGLEITLNGPILKFNCASTICLTGAPITATLNGDQIAMWQSVPIKAGDQLQLGSISDAGSRAYLLVIGGIQSPDYLGSQSTFTLGKFGGHSGRQLRAGDTLHLPSNCADSLSQKPVTLPEQLRPKFSREWTIHVIYGPHGAPDFFTDNDIDSFFNTEWEIHYNSSRTGIRLIGPKPEWARSDGGEAGMHPSNIHDNAYAIGSIDFTGDMPVILGPDGPSLGGFVCPATVISAERWKLGQLRAGDKLRFVPVTLQQAKQAEAHQQAILNTLDGQAFAFSAVPATTPIIKTLASKEVGIDVVYRLAGDKYLLIEYGPLMLDIELRFRVHALMQWLDKNALEAILEMTPGIRSLQIHYDSQRLNIDDLLSHLEKGERAMTALDDMSLPSRIVHLPLSWDDEACRLAIEKYMQSVRPDAPWCPSNIEFIRRINGLESIEAVKQIVFDASYLVMGLGDVYLGAPVATPLDPRHRLVTTKYNPARTWTAENSVGIGGAYLCVYGMEGPGGYQFVGRTLQMWNRDRATREFTQPWLLRFFDQIRFYPVSADELKQIREDFPRGHYPLRIEHSEFSLKDYGKFLNDNAASIADFTQQRDQAFAEELERWVASGQINYESNQQLNVADDSEQALPSQCIGVDSPVAGSVWQINVQPDQQVEAGELLAIIESMKMEIQISAPQAGRIHSIRRSQGAQVQAGTALIWLETTHD